MHPFLRPINKCDVSTDFKYRPELGADGEVIGFIDFGQVVGYTYFTNSTTDIHILFMEILESYRRQGMGKDMIRYLLDKHKGKKLRLIPGSYEAAEYFKNRLKDGTLPSDTSLEG